MYALCHTTKKNQSVPINWSQIGGVELGSVFEALLERHPEMDCQKWNFVLATKDGNDRKSTGSYYTPRALVDCLLDSTLERVMNKAVHQQSQEEQERSLLQLRISILPAAQDFWCNCKPGPTLAKVRSGNSNPVLIIQVALRDVVKDVSTVSI